MVEMGVGQQDRVELGRLERERDPVPDRFVRAALEHPAVDQDPGAIGDEQELRAGDGGRAAEELDVHGRHGDSATAGPRILRADGHRGGRTVVRRTARRPRRHRRRTDPRRARRSRTAGRRRRSPAATGGGAGGSRSSSPSVDRRRAVWRGRPGARQHARVARLDRSDGAHARPATSGSGGRARRRAAGEDPAVARARAALIRRYGEAASSIRVGAETLHRLTVLARLGTEPDPRRGAACSRRSLPCGASSMATAATRVRIGASSAPAPSDGGAPARRSMRTSRRSACRRTAFEPLLHDILAAWRTVSVRAGSNPGTTGTRSAPRHAPRRARAARIACSS